MNHIEVGKKFTNIGRGVFARQNELGNIELADTVIDGVRMKPHTELVLI